MKRNKLLLVAILLTVTLVLSGCVSQEALESPIYFEGGFFTKYIVYPVAWLLYTSTDLFGGYYFIGILVTTLVVRTIGWPIYAKSNETNIRMQAMQPEQQKIQAKYAGKKDRESQMRQQQEVQALYKKYGVNPLGCFLPFLQMPIFLAVYYAVRRLPLNIGSGILDLDSIGASTNFVGIDLMTPVNGALSSDFLGNILYLIVPIFTGVTMYLVTSVSQRRSKKQQSDVPEYRRNEQAQNMQRQMGYMLYFMVAMMVWISYISPAALGIYWTIGNLYSLVQTTINYRNSDKKMKDIKASV